MAGYSREEFPHWSTVSGACNTRDTVLERDGEGVRTDSSCAATSGSWFSPYDDATWTDASDVDIDHVVPLAGAWRSGADDWTGPRREAFANDLDGPQLIAVTDNVNQSKGRELFDGVRVFVSFRVVLPGQLAEVAPVVGDSRVPGRGWCRRILSVVGPSVRGVIRAFLFALDPTDAQAEAFRSHCGA